MVGVRGLEPPTPRPPGECATRLRHTPNDLVIIGMKTKIKHNSLPYLSVMVKQFKRITKCHINKHSPVKSINL